MAPTLFLLWRLSEIRLSKCLVISKGQRVNYTENIFYGYELGNVKYLFRPKPLFFSKQCMKAKCRKILFCRNDVILFLTWCILIMISTSLNLCLRVHPIFHGGSKKAIIKETASATAAVTIKAIETGIFYWVCTWKFYLRYDKEVHDQTTATFLLHQAAVKIFRKV